MIPLPGLLPHNRNEARPDPFTSMASKYCASASFLLHVGSSVHMYAASTLLSNQWTFAVHVVSVSFVCSVTDLQSIWLHNFVLNFRSSIFNFTRRHEQAPMGHFEFGAYIHFQFQFHFHIVGAAYTAKRHQVTTFFEGDLSPICSTTSNFVG